MIGYLEGRRRGREGRETLGVKRPEGSHLLVGLYLGCSQDLHEMIHQSPSSFSLSCDWSGCLRESVSYILSTGFQCVELPLPLPLGPRMYVDRCDRVSARLPSPNKTRVRSLRSASGTRVFIRGFEACWGWGWGRWQQGLKIRVSILSSACCLGVSLRRRSRRCTVPRLPMMRTDDVVKVP